MAAAGCTALADKSGGRGSVQTCNDDGTAIFANSQDVRDALPAHMTGWGGRFFKTCPEVPKELPQRLHTLSMSKIKS
jgi:hypothetical protein